MKSALTHRLIQALLLAALLSVLACLPALAVEAPVLATMTITPDEMSVPVPVTAHIKIENISGADLTSPLTLYDPSGRKVTAFGDNGSLTLKAGESTTINRELNVTQEMIDQGKVSYSLHWIDEEGRELVLPVVAEVHFNGEKAGLRIVRTISPKVVRSGQTVKITYELTNTGAVSISNIQVKEKITRQPKTVKNLAIGATATVEFSAKMGNQDLVSGAEVTFKPAGGSQSESSVIEDETIPTAVKGLNVEIALDKNAVDIGQTVRLILTARNEGNITYENVVAEDKNLGKVFEGLTFPAYETVTEERELTVSQPTSYQLKLTLQDNTNMTNTMTTNQVSVSAYDPERELLLTLVLKADCEGITTAPADVAMTVDVTNASNVDCKNVVIKHGAVTIYTIPDLAAGQTVTIKRDYTVSQAGRFRFTATAKDTVGNTVSFESNTLTLNYQPVTAAPTTVPTPTIAPLVTLEPVTYENASPILRKLRDGLYTASFVLGGLAAAALLLFLVSTIVRGSRKIKSEKAVDHLELTERRDYTRQREDAEELSGEPLPERKPAAGDKPDEEAARGETEQSESGGFRMSRDRQTDNFPTYREAMAQTPDGQSAAQEKADEAASVPAEQTETESAVSAESAADADIRADAGQAPAPRPDHAPIPDRRRRSRSRH